MTRPYSTVEEEFDDITTVLKRQLSRVREACLNMSNQDVSAVLESIASEYVLENNSTVVGIRMHYNPSFEYLTRDNKTTVIEKAIEHFQKVMHNRETLNPLGESKPLNIEKLCKSVDTIFAHVIRSRSYSALRSFRREFLDLVLDNISESKGLSRYTISHPTWAVGARTYAVIVSKRHYANAHALSKLYGFRSCAVMMSFAQSEYLEFLKKEQVCYA